MPMTGSMLPSTTRVLIVEDEVLTAAVAKDELEQRMALVPAGNVSIPQTIGAESGGPEQEFSVEPFLLDVHCVTNARFQRFVDAGGYDALEYWPEEIWPHLIELKDLTGQPGPRFWRQGRCDVRLAEHTIVQPDLVVVLADRRHILTASRVEGAPSLVVEIISPSTSAYDRETKRRTYAQHEVPEYWLVNAEAQTLTVCSEPRDGRYRRETVFADMAVSATIPGLSADLEALFASVPDW